MQGSTYLEKWVLFSCVKDTLLLSVWFKEYLSGPSTVTLCVVKYKSTWGVSTHVESNKRNEHIQVSLS